MKRVSASLAVVALAAVFFFAGIAVSNTFPPKINAYFMGDANGDTGVTGADIVQHYNYILSKAYTYDTLQPNNSAQAWNTCDMNSDRGCTGSDTVILNSYLLSKAVSVPDDPWSVNNINLPLSGNATGVLIPFNIDLHGTHASLGASGRPGVSVVVEIDAALSTITGELSGRECNPVAGTRDQLVAANAQCAIAVSQTNWPVSAGTGPTESGTYGLQVMGDATGTLNLKVYTTAINGLDIPATSTRLIVAFTGVPTDVVALTCPTNVGEDASSSCTITASGPSVCTVGAATTCTGVTLTACTQLDIAAQGEAAGPGSCVVEVTKGLVSDSKIITIDEVNQAPTIGVVCGSADEDAAGSCALTVADADLPANTLTCSVDPSTTCSGVTLTGCTTANVPAQGEGGARSCIVAVTVNDNTGAGNATALGSGNFGITDVNIQPTIALTCPGSVVEPAAINCTIASSDGDVPADSLSCSIGAGDTCGGILAGCASYSLASSAGKSPSCVVDVVVNDNSGAGNATNSDSAIVTVGAESITLTCPASADETASFSCTIASTGGSGCSIGAGTTCTGATLTNCTQIDFTAQGESAGGTACSVQVFKGATANDTKSVNIIETNQNPVITSTCATTATEGVAYSCALTATDADTPAQTLTWSTLGSNSCGGTITGSTYNWTPSESQGGFNCFVSVQVADNFATPGVDTQATDVAVAEANELPVITSTCSAAASEGVAYSCALTATDADTPAQTLTWSLSAGNTCAGTIVGSTYNSWTPSEAQGGTTCVVGVQVADNFAPAGTATQNTTVTIAETNQLPVITSTCSASASEGVAYSCALTATDADTPAQTLTWSLSAGNTCAGTVVGSTYNSWTPSEAQGGTTCVVGVQVADNFAPAGTATQNTTVTIAETNQLPVITSTCSASASEGVAYSCALTATDADTPAQTLTWSLSAGNTCAGTVVGSTYNSWTPSEAQGGTTCVVGVQVADNFAPAGTATQNTTVTIAETNQLPVITSTCSASASEGVAYSCALTATDADTPAQTLTWSLSAGNTCAGTVVGSTYNSWTPSEAQGGTTCVVGVQVADNFAPAGTATQNTTVTIAETNQLPVITSTCSASASEGVAYSCALTATDADTPAQTLTWSLSAGNTCAGTVVGSTYNSWTPSEAQGGTNCVVGVQVADNFAPAGTATQNTTVTIAETNQIPVITSTCSASASEGVAYSCALTATDADTPAQTLTWSLSAGNTCAGTVVGSTYNSWTPSEAQGGTTCVVGVQVADNFAPAGTATQNTTVTIAEVNAIPTWTAAPTTINILPSTGYNQVNGTGGDTDLPNTAASDPGYIGCAKTAQTCSFTVTVTNSGTRQGTVGCNLSFTSGSGAETCTVTLQVSDGWTPAGQTAATPLTINVSGTGINITGVSVSGTLGGIDPTIARIKNNYPADWTHFTINFDGSPGATCDSTITCGGVDQPATGAVSGNNCVMTVTAGYWRSTSTCTISATTTAATCTNCAAYTNTFNTSLRTSECATRGGTCGGFIDTTQYGTGDGLNVYLIDMKSITGAYVIPATNYVYVLVEHPAQVPPRRIETFDGNRDGLVTVTSASTPALLSEPVKITASYKGGSGMCEVNSNENVVCYRFVTMSDIDSRRVNLPMELTTVGDWALPEAQLWLYTPIANFSTYVGGTPANNSFPNPIRAGFAVLSLIDQGMSSINLDDLLRPTGESSTLSLCFGSLGLNVGGIDLPGNLLLPDVIRQDWNAACSGSWKMSPALTTYRIFTNRPSMTRRVIVMGASVVTTLFDLYKVSLDLTALPITMTALGTSTINIGAIAADLNIGDVTGAWGTTTALYPTPHSVPFEFDYRSTTAAYPVTLHEANPPYDPARVALGTAATPDYGDPNRSGGANHSGQMYVYGENLLISGVRGGAAGLIPFQLVMTPKIDDSVFTVFQRHNTNSKSFNDQEPWGTASTNSRVVSATMRGLPSTTVDADITWATANVGLVGIMMRGFCESAYPGVASSGIDLPGSSANSNLFGGLETIQGTTTGTHSWLPIPTMSSPANDGMRVPPQSELVARAWPVNRNGQLMRGTATIAAHSIQTALGARYFTLSNPLVNTSATRRADLYYFDIKDTRHIANPFYDAVRHYPDNTLWRLYGNVNAQASLTVTLPFIAPRRVTLTGVYGVVPDPWEAGNFTNLSMDWSLTELIIDSGARGMTRAWNYQNMSVVWLYEMSYLSSSEAAQFIWH